MRRVFSFGLLAVTAVCLFFPGWSRAQNKPHPHIHHALFELREARKELKTAAHNFGGHRKAAMAAINTAISQLDKALKYSGDKRPFKGDPKAEVYRKYANYPHIRHAHDELKATVAEMKAASHDYGGHRKQALIDTEAAIKQLALAIKHAKATK